MTASQVDRCARGRRRRAVVVCGALVLAFALPARLGYPAAWAVSPSPGSAASPPVAGTIFVANVTGNSITEYAPGASGNAPPVATISGPNTGLTGPQGIAVDASGDVFAANPGNNSITEYSPGASGDVFPAATIAGANTGLSFPEGVAVDSTGDIFAGNYLGGSITEYSPGATGNATPIATISGSSTGLGRPHGLAFDSAGTLFVAIVSNEVLEFAPGASGNATPVRVIAGPGTGLNGAEGPALDPAGNLFVANPGTPSVTTYAPGASGNASPKTDITGSSTGLKTPEGIAVDSSGDVLVANESGGSITEYAPGANGNAAPAVTISGANTGLSAPRGIVVVPISTATPAKLVFITQPSGATAGIVFGTQPRVAVEDAAGNIVTTDTSNVTLSITTGTGSAGASLTCTANPLAASAGIATFAGCAISKPGTSYKLHATDGSLAAADSASFNVGSAAAAKLVFLTHPAGATAGVVFRSQPRVAVEDAAGNIITADTSHVTLSIRPGSGVSGAALTCLTNPVSASHGVAVFPGCEIDKAGTGYALHASDGSLRAANSGRFTVANPGASHAIRRLVWSPSPLALAGSLRHGTTVHATVTALDTAGHKIGGAKVYLSFQPASSNRNLDNATATCGNGRPLPRFCQADPAGQIQVTYTNSTGPPVPGSDTLTAAADQYGTRQAQDSYTYPADTGAPVTTLTWDHSPIAPAGALHHQAVTLTLATADAAGNPVPDAPITLTFTPPTGSDATINSPLCGGTTTTLTCHTDRSGHITVTYTSSSTPATGSDALTATFAAHVPITATTLYTYSLVRRLAWDPSPLALAGSLRHGISVHATVTAFDAAGHRIGGAKVYISFQPASSNHNLDNATATCGNGRPLPRFCQADPAGQVQVTYTNSTGPPVPGSDTLTAAADQYGTRQAQDSYTYPAPPAITYSTLSWDHSPIAPAGTLHHQSVTLTLTPVDTAGNPVPDADVILVFVPALGSDATITSPQCAPTLVCQTGPSGHITVTYTSSSTPATGSDAIFAQPTDPSVTNAITLYTYSPIRELVWDPSPLALAGSLPPGTTVHATVTAFDSAGHRISGAEVFLTFQFGQDGASATCGSGTPLPAFCRADAAGQVQVTYKNSTLPPVAGSDTLFAAADTDGTRRALDSYTYPALAGAPVTAVNWDHSPIAPAGTLHHESVTLTLTPVDAAGNPVPDAPISLILVPAIGSDATISSPQCTGTAPTLTCQTGPSGHITVEYTSSSTPATGSDALTATFAAHTPVTTTNLYTY
jgi:pyrimidine deaminase RibD-like protein